MLSSIKSFAASFEFASQLALFVYWIPFAICITVYGLRWIGMYKHDLAKVTERFYVPKLTVGVIVWHFICSITPCVNLFSMVFDCSSSVFIWLGKFLNIPLVKPRIVDFKD